LTLTPDGRRTPAPFRPAADPAVDCFYVYPTVSNDGGMFSDLSPGPEERRTVLVQAARFRSVCRVFAPNYRQVTMMGLGLSVSWGVRTGARPTPTCAPPGATTFGATTAGEGSC
jgi:hypothetical protein